MRKQMTFKGKKSSLRTENKFVIRKLSMTDRMRIRSSKARTTMLKGRKAKFTI